MSLHYLTYYALLTILFGVYVVVLSCVTVPVASLNAQPRMASIITGTGDVRTASNVPPSTAITSGPRGNVYFPIKKPQNIQIPVRQFTYGLTSLEYRKTCELFL